MSRLKDILTRGTKTASSEEFAKTQRLILEQGEANQPDQSALDRIQSFPFKYEVIHDETTEAILEDKVGEIIYLPKMKEDGSGILYATNKDGEILLDGQGNPLPEYEKHIKINDYYASLLTALSHKNRLTFLQKGNSILYNLMVEDLKETVKMSIPEDGFGLGTANYLDSLGLEAFMLGNDAVNGNKVKALLEHRKTTRFEFDENKNKKKGYF